MRVTAQEVLHDLDGILEYWYANLPSRIQAFAKSILVAESSIPNEASYRGEQILVGPKFWDLSDDGKIGVLTHELGHAYRQEFVPLEKIMPWNSPFGNSDLTNGQSEEDFAQAFSDFLLSGVEFHQKHPDLYQAMLDFV
jgi:hypothetical protein